jgi:K+-transporting ATPase ATPase C chain
MMLRHHIRFFVIAMGIAGILYPLALGGIGQFLFPWQTNGSLIYDKGHPVGSPNLKHEVQQYGKVLLRWERNTDN